MLDDAGVRPVDDLVRVPYRLPDGTEHNAKVFAPSGRTWWEARGRELLPFGLETLEELDANVVADVALLVCEGESDCLACREVYAHTLPGAAVRAYRVLGLPGSNTWRAAWRRWLRPYSLIYVLGDGDDAGKAMMNAVVADVPWARPVLLPDGEDARSVVQRDPRGLDPHLDRADRRAAAWFGMRRAGSLGEFQAILAGDTVTTEEVIRRAA